MRDCECVSYQNKVSPIVDENYPQVFKCVINVWQVGLEMLRTGVHPGEPSIQEQTLAPMKSEGWIIPALKFKEGWRAFLKLTDMKTTHRYEIHSQKLQSQPGCGVWWWGHAFHPSTQGGRGRQISVSSRIAWFTEWVLGQPKIHRETLSSKTKQNNTEKEKKGKRQKKKQEKKLQSRPTLSSIGSKELSDWTEDQGVIHNWDARNLRLMLQPC